jgi:rod shape-determining protein MreD
VKHVLALLVLGALAPMLQGVMGTFVPLQYCPDFGLLLVAGLGLHWRSTNGGVVLAATLGFITDLLSSSLLGQHTLLRLFAFGAARLASQQFNLRGVMPQVIFFVLLTGLNALGTAALTAFFVVGRGWDGAMLASLLPHALINGIVGPLVVALVSRIATGWGEAEPGHSLFPIRPRKRLS